MIFVPPLTDFSNVLDIVAVETDVYEAQRSRAGKVLRRQRWAWLRIYMNDMISIDLDRLSARLEVDWHEQRCVVVSRIGNVLQKRAGDGDSTSHVNPTLTFMNAYRIPIRLHTKCTGKVHGTVRN